MTLSVADVALPGVRLMIQYRVWDEPDGAKLKYLDKNLFQGHFVGGGYHMDVAFFQVSLLNVRRYHHHNHHKIMICSYVSINNSSARHRCVWPSKVSGQARCLEC
jgi:hypothetical protein